jgi:hypothetical protein
LTSLHVEEFEHRIRHGTRGGIRNPFDQHLIKLLTEYFFSSTAMKVRWFTHRASHRGKHLPEQRLANEISKRITQWFFAWKRGSYRSYNVRVGMPVNGAGCINGSGHRIMQCVHGAGQHRV